MNLVNKLHLGFWSQIHFLYINQMMQIIKRIHKGQWVNWIKFKLQLKWIIFIRKLLFQSKNQLVKQWLELHSNTNNNKTKEIMTFQQYRKLRTWQVIYKIHLIKLYANMNCYYKLVMLKTLNSMKWERNATNNSETSCNLKTKQWTMMFPSKEKVKANNQERAQDLTKLKNKLQLSKLKIQPNYYSKLPKLNQISSNLDYYKMI